MSESFVFSEIEAGIDPDQALIYLWEVFDLNGDIWFWYVGKAAGGADRPRTHYRRNVNNLLVGKPYRKSRPDEFRVAHRKLAEATKLKYFIRLLYVCNIAPDEDINAIEQYWRTHYDSMYSHAPRPLAREMAPAPCHVRSVIRPIDPRDEPRWRVLWDGYCRFYEREPDEAITCHLWARIMDPASPVQAIVAERDGQVIGIANYLPHDNTSTLTPVCYLQDLYVEPGLRAGGVGQQLIDWLVAEMKRQGWSRLYWNTKENNYRARGLYDKYTPHSGFLRYVINNPDL